ncbi:MAG: hypothetical protein ICV83_06315, partial [Cytophagales bacterium]|nr:hypothetical protein [Cytophagales bacterium]
MTRSHYLLTAVLIYLLAAGCRQLQREAQEVHPSTPILATLASLKAVQAYETERAFYRLRELVLERGREPADTLMLFRAQQLMRHVQQATQSPAGQPPIDTLRQLLHRLDRQALLLGRVMPYTRTKRIPRYLALLAAPTSPVDTSKALRTGLQVEIVRHTRVILNTVTRQLESRGLHQSLLIPVVRQHQDSVLV